MACASKPEGYTEGRLTLMVATLTACDDLASLITVHTPATHISIATPPHCHLNTVHKVAVCHMPVICFVLYAMIKR